MVVTNFQLQEHFLMHAMQGMLFAWSASVWSAAACPQTTYSRATTAVAQSTGADSNNEPGDTMTPEGRMD